jgi:hypothetical protein
MAIEGLAADAEFAAQVCDDRTFLAEGVLCQSQLRWCHFRFASTITTAGTCGSKTGDGALTNQLALEFR